MTKGWKGEKKKHSIAAKKGIAKKKNRLLFRKQQIERLKMSDSDLRSEMMAADRRQSRWR